MPPKRGQSYKEIKIPAQVTTVGFKWPFIRSSWIPIPFAALDASGVAEPIVESGEPMKVGWKHTVTDGDWGFIVRGLLYIDISPIKEMESRYRFAIISAKLNLLRGQTSHNSGEDASNVGSAARHVYVLEEPFETSPGYPWGYDTPARIFTTLSPDEYPEINIDITNLFISWYKNEQSNFGLMFVGDNETTEKDNWSFFSDYSDVTASVVCLGYFN